MLQIDSAAARHARSRWADSHLDLQGMLEAKKPDKSFNVFTRYRKLRYAYFLSVPMAAMPSPALVEHFFWQQIPALRETHNSIPREPIPCDELKSD
jgi:hypothetical protein